jgi:hypothetical protein
MRLPLTRLENIALTTITIPLTISSLCLLLLVRLGDYIVNLWDFYFYKFIGKLTDFLQLQEFNLWNITVTRNCTLPFHVRTKISFFILKPKNCRSGTTLKEEDDEKCPVPLPRRGVLLTTQIQDWEHSRQDFSINLVSIFRVVWGTNPVYTSRVDPSSLTFISVLLPQTVPSNVVETSGLSLEILGQTFK